MHRLRIYILCMSENLILFPAPIDVETLIIGQGKKTCRLEKACVMKRAFIWQLVSVCFYCIYNVLNGSRIYCIDNADSYEMYKLRIYISWMSENVILLVTYLYLCRYVYYGPGHRTLEFRKSLPNRMYLYVTICNLFTLLHI